MQEMKKVIGYDNYFVDSTGNVFSSYNGELKTLSLRIKKDGYATVNLYQNGKRKTWLAHRLIAIAFISNPENKLEIDHINGMRHDNRIENLRWCTKKENANFELVKNRLSKAFKGRTVTAEHREKIAKTLKEKYANGTLISPFKGKTLSASHKAVLREKSIKYSDEDLLCLWFYRYDNHLTEKAFREHVGRHWETIRYTVKYRKLA